MKRILSLLSITSIIAFAVPAVAQASHLGLSTGNNVQQRQNLSRAECADVIEDFEREQDRKQREFEENVAPYHRHVQLAARLTHIRERTRERANFNRQLGQTTDCSLAASSRQPRRVIVFAPKTQQTVFRSLRLTNQPPRLAVTGTSRLRGRPGIRGIRGTTSREDRIQLLLGPSK